MLVFFFGSFLSFRGKVSYGMCLVWVGLGGFLFWGCVMNLLPQDIVGFISLWYHISSHPLQAKVLLRLQGTSQRQTALSTHPLLVLCRRRAISLLIHTVLPAVGVHGVNNLAQLLHHAFPPVGFQSILARGGRSGNRRQLL